MNSLMKTAPLVGSTELATDDRAYHRLSVMAMGVEDTQLLLYPRLIPLVSLLDLVFPPTTRHFSCVLINILIKSALCQTAQHGHEQ